MLGHSSAWVVVLPIDQLKAYEMYRAAADQGRDDGQLNVGHCFDVGIGVASNLPEAMRWYQLAADKNNDYAQYNVGRLHYNGGSVEIPVNDQEAVKWFKISANQGNGYAQSMLGECYELGEGVTVNIRQAVKWYELAIAQGNDEAVDCLNDLIAREMCAAIDQVAERP